MKSLMPILPLTEIYSCVHLKTIFIGYNQLAINIYTMLFAYLNLPKIPDEFISACLENLKLIGSDPRLIPINEYRGPMNRATFLPTKVSTWLVKNIVNPYFKTTMLDNNMLLNITRYTNHHPDPTNWGNHGRHVDVGRNYALNYYFETGGPDARTLWYHNDEKKPYAKTIIEPKRWALLKVNPEMHGVRGIQPNTQRVFVSMGLLTENIENFNEEEFFKEIIVKESIIG
jgi:hypothetical protein